MSYFNVVNVQDSNNATINPATKEGQNTGNASIANVDTNIGAKADTEATTDNGVFSLISLFKRGLLSITSLLTKIGDGSQKTQVTNGLGTPVDFLSANSDTRSNTANSNLTSSRISAYNGTSWDRIRSGVKGVVSSLLGYLNVIPVGTYNLTPPSLANGQSIEPQVTSEGRLKVEAVFGTPASNLSQQFIYEKNEATMVTNQWQTVYSYTVPNTYNLDVVAFQGDSTQAGDVTRVVMAKDFGSYSLSTKVFTSSGVSWSSPQFATKLYVYVTSVIGGTNDTLTITYTNQDGVSGRTATLAIPRNTIAGSRLEVSLQAGDTGVISVSSVSNVTTQVGAVIIESLLELTHLTLVVANTTYEQIYSSNSLIISSGTDMRFQYNSHNAGAKRRRISLSATFKPRG